MMSFPPLNMRFFGFIIVSSCFKIKISSNFQQYFTISFQSSPFYKECYGLDQNANVFLTMRACQFQTRGWGQFCNYSFVDFQFLRGWGDGIIMILKMQRKLTKKQLKQLKDDDFKPNSIRKRASYRKISQHIKNVLAQSYYVQKIKMSKLVKKYNISFSTITDILKKYDTNGRKIAKNMEESTPPPPNDQNQEYLKVKTEIKAEYIYPFKEEAIEEPQHPQYLYYST